MTQIWTWLATQVPGELHPMLESLGAEYPLVRATDASAPVNLELLLREGLDGWRAELHGEVVRIEYGAPAAAARALGALLAGLVTPGSCAGEQAGWRTLGIMLDCSRNAVMRVEHLERWMRRLALLGFNTLMLYTEDTYQLPDEPYFGYLRGAYTRAELERIVRSARALGLEVIPCIQVLGHLEAMLRWNHYAPLRDTPRIALCEHEPTYALIGKMLDHAREVFGSPRICIGMDEAHELGSGGYMDRFGHRPQFEIFSRHLERVTRMCTERGLRPMIYSDMYFRMGSAQRAYYDEDAKIPPEVVSAIPSQVDLVYWDYYHDSVEFYRRWIGKHRALGKEPVMFSAVWTWYRFWYDAALTEAHAAPCIEACRHEGVRDLFFSLWHDDGACCDIDSALAGLAFAADRAWAAHETADPQALARRFRAVCGADYDANRLGGQLNGVPGVQGTSFNTFLALWDDPLLGIYLQNMLTHDPQALEKARAHCAALADKLAGQVNDRGAGDLPHAALQAHVLAAKIGLAQDLILAYRAGDRAGLAAVRSRIPHLIENIGHLERSWRVQWMTRHKAFGLDAIQRRLGGLRARYEELDRQLAEYLKGTLPVVEELEANLPQAPGGELDVAFYHQVAGASPIH